MDIFDVFRDRRSVRRYRDEPLERETIEEVLHAARLAPSWKNQQCWSFLVLTEAEKRLQATEALHEDNPGRKALAQAPVIILVCADPQLSGVEDGKEYYMADAATAFAHLCLAAHAKGLGTCWIGWFDEDRLKTQLGIPPHLRVIGLTPLGHPDQAPSPRPRKDLDQIAHFDIWRHQP